MAKGMYMGKSSGPVNQRLANLITNEQFLLWEETELFDYKSMYLTSKAWVLLKLQHSHPSQPISSSVEGNFNSINNER